jgi:hypothetical protein
MYECMIERTLSHTSFPLLKQAEMGGQGPKIPLLALSEKSSNLNLRIGRSQRRVPRTPSAPEQLKGPTCAHDFWQQRLQWVW